MPKAREEAILRAMDDQECRLTLLAIDDAKVAARSAGVPSSMAHLNVFRALLNHPELAGAVSGLLSMLLWKGNRLDERLRELIIMRIGWRTGALYEWTQHWHVAKRIGLEDEELLAVRDWRACTKLDAGARAVLAATDDILDAGVISAQAWEECRNTVGNDAQLAEMVVAISNWRMFSELLRSLRIPLESGVAPWPPNGEQPQLP